MMKKIQLVKNWPEIVVKWAFVNLIHFYSDYMFKFFRLIEKNPLLLL